MGFIFNLALKKDFKKRLIEAEILFKLSRKGITQANHIYWDYNLVPMYQPENVDLKKFDESILLSIENIKKLKILITEIKEIYAKNPNLFRKFQADYNKAIFYISVLLNEIQQIVDSIKEVDSYKNIYDLKYTLQQLNKLKKELETNTINNKSTQIQSSI